MLNRYPRQAASLALLLALAAPLPSAFAQDDCEDGKQPGSMTEATYRVVESAQKQLEEKNYAEAEKKLVRIKDGVEGYERAIVFQTLGYLYTQQDRLKEAIPYFEEALALDALPQQPQENLLYNTGQLYSAVGRYDDAIALLEKYIRESCTPPSADAHIQLAAAYLEKERFREALRQVDTAISKAKKPSEQWLQIKLGLHYELGEYARCADVLMDLITLSPDKEQYWRQLSSVLYEINRDEQSVAVLALAQRQGFLESESEYRNLLGLYMQTEVPLKAALLFKEGMDKGIVPRTPRNLQVLSEAYIVAREYDEAESALRAAATLADSGDVWKRLGQVYVEQERWDEAIDALGKALNKGVDKVGETQLLLGVAAFNAGQDQRARTALLAATRYPESENNARQWLNFVR